MRRLLQKCNTGASDAQSQVLSFEKDHQNVHQRVVAAQTAGSAGQAPSWVSCDGFGDIREAHMKQLAALEEPNRSSREAHAYFSQGRAALARAVFARLRSISALQSRVRDLYNRTALFRQAQARQDAAVEHLECLRFMPAAYQASLDEVLRRRAFGRRLAADLRRLTDRLAHVRDEEMGRREQFLAAHGRYIMKDLVPGLNDLLPTFELVCPPFDVSLPAIGSPNQALEDAVPLLSFMGDERGAGAVTGRVKELEHENARLQHELQELREREAKRPAAHSHSPPATSALTSSTDAGDTAKSQQLISGYKERIQQLEAKLSTTYAKLSEMEDETRSKRELEQLLGDAVESARRQSDAEVERARRLQHMESDHAALRTQLDQVQTALADANRRLSASSERNAEEVDALRREVARLTDALRRANEELAAARERLVALEPLPEQLARTQRDAEQLRKSSERSAADLEAARASMATMRTQQESTQRDFDSTRAELARLKEANAALVAAARELDLARAQILDLGASRSSLQSTAAQLDEARAAMARRAEELAAEKSRLESTVARLEQTQRDSLARLETLTAERARLTDDLAALKADLETRLRDRDKQLADSNAKLKQITLNNAHQENEIVRLKKAELDVARRLEALSASERQQQESSRRLHELLLGLHKLLQAVPLPPEPAASGAVEPQDLAELLYIQRAVAHLLEVNKRLSNTISELDQQLARDMSADKRRSSIILREYVPISCCTCTHTFADVLWFALCAASRWGTW